MGCCHYVITVGVVAIGVKEYKGVESISHLRWCTKFFVANKRRRHKKNMSPYFYVSLIIEDKIIHNFMIDSGASSSLMPKCIPDLLGNKYEPMVRDIL